MTRRVFALALLLAVIRSGALAAQRVGLTFRVNSYTTNSQGPARVVYHPDGRFVVAWISDYFGPGLTRIVAQRFAASGTPLGPQFLVNGNSLATGNRTFSMAGNSAEFVTVWEEALVAGDVEVHGKRFTWDGTAQPGEFRVNTVTTGTHRAPSVAFSGGEFVVVWNQLNALPEVAIGIYGRRFNNLVQPLTGDFRISTALVSMSSPIVAIDGTGRFMTIWAEGDLLGRRYAASGAPDSEPFVVDGAVHPSDLAASPAGGFVVVHGGFDGSGYAITMRRYSSAGESVGSAVRVNTSTAGDQERPSVAFGSTGNFLVTWQSADTSTRGQFFGADAAPISNELSLGSLLGQDVAATGGGFAAVGTIGTDVYAQRLSPPPLPVGAEFRVGAMFYPSIVQEGSGDFVVAWRGSVGFFVQRFSATGAPSGAQLSVPAEAVSFPRPGLASDSAGGFVLFWDEVILGSGDSTFDIYAQRLSGSAAAVGARFRVNTSSAEHHQRPSAKAAAGGFVVVWQAAAGDGNGGAILGRRFSSSGEPLAAEFVVNSISTGNQRYPFVASNASGAFIVAWIDGNNPALNLNARRFGSSGSPDSLDFRVSTHTGAARQSVALGEDGSFVVVWDSDGLDGSLNAIASQRFSSSGAPLGGELVVNTETAFNQYGSSVSMDEHGRFVIAWGSPFNNVYGVFEQVYKKSGEPLGSTFRVSSATLSTQRPVVSFGKTWVTMWDQNNGGGNFDLHALLLAPPCRSSDADGNGSINVVDILYLINHLFAGGPPPHCGGDADGNGIVNVSDVLFLINFLFAGGPAPV